MPCPVPFCSPSSSFGGTNGHLLPVMSLSQPFPPSPDEDEPSQTEEFAVLSEQSEGEMESILRRVSVRQALARLPIEDRHIVHRLFWDEATFEEVAKEVGISRRALHKRWNKVKEWLREWLE